MAYDVHYIYFLVLFEVRCPSDETLGTTNSEKRQIVHVVF